MKRINLHTAELDRDEADPDGYVTRAKRLGPELGAERLGMSIYEIPPGQSICPYHYEHGEEEWLIVLSGRPTIRHPQGEDVLEPGDVVLFPCGAEGAHKVTNATDETLRVLMFSNVEYPAVTIYPDSNKVGVYTRGRVDNALFRRETAVEYFDREI